MQQTGYSIFYSAWGIEDPGANYTRQIILVVGAKPVWCLCTACLSLRWWPDVSDLFIIQAALDLLWGGEGGSYDILIAYIDDPTATFDMSYTCQMDTGACIIWWGSVTCLLLPWTSFAVLFCHLPVRLLVKHVRMCHMRRWTKIRWKSGAAISWQLFFSNWRNPWQL